MTLDRLRSAARIRQALQEIRASYWFIPACMVLGALVLAGVVNLSDGLLSEADLQLPAAVAGLGPDGARTLIATIASAVIGVTGVMFSLTLVAVTHAAGKYGPRLIGNFLRDRGNQWTLGILIGAFTFAIVNLWLMGGPEERVPHLVVLGTFLAIFPSIGAVIFFVHHVPETINVSNIAAGLGHRLIRMVREEIEGAEGEDEPSPDLPDRAPDHELTAPAGGYVQALDYSDLERWAEEEGAMLRVEVAPGGFVAPRSVWLSVWDADPDEEDRTRLMRAVATGAQPTETQTVTFVADQLVEMAALALSPGINDPFTAITCLDWLSAGLMEALEYRGGLCPTDRGRVKRPALGIARLYERTFPAAGPYVRADAMASAHAAELLYDLAGRADDPRMARRMRADARSFRDAAQPA